MERRILVMPSVRGECFRTHSLWDRRNGRAIPRTCMNRQGPLTIANVQVDVYVPRNAFAGTESW
jgi:hypothetical protein